MMLTPDELQAEIYRHELAPNMKKGAALMFAHGLNVHFNLIERIGSCQTGLKTNRFLASSSDNPLVAFGLNGFNSFSNDALVNRFAERVGEPGTGVRARNSFPEKLATRCNWSWPRYSRKRYC